MSVDMDMDVAKLFSVRARARALSRLKTEVIGFLLTLF